MSTPSVDERLKRHFAAVPEPTAVDVEAAVVARIETTVERPRQRRASLLLALYWLAALVASALIVAALPAPAREPWVLAIGSTFLVSIFLPAWFLARSMRVGLGDLFLRTLD